MARKGSTTFGFGLLHNLHADGCDGRESAKMQPVVVPQGLREEPPYADASQRGAKIECVIMEWCGECGAADWEVV